MKTRYVLGCLVAFRVLNALLCTTFFQPDEFFQSLEVAHRLVFGYGWQTWEWRQQTALRSPLHALLFVPGYWLVKVLGLEDTDAIVAAPKVIQGVVAAINDYYTARLASMLFRDGSHSQVALFCSVASFFNAGVTVRTFSNSLEAALTAAALSYWPWYNDGSFTLPLFIAGISCIIRPTSAIIWLFMAMTVLASKKRTTSLRLLRNAILPVITGACVCLAIDTWFYGHITFTPLNFLRVNVLEQISVFYGANPCHFYITQALPFDMLALLPFTLHGTWSILSQVRNAPSRTVTFAALANIAALSLLSHKEFRFIQPLLPIFHCITAHSLLVLSAPLSATAGGYSWLPRIKKSYVNFIIGLNVPGSIVFIAIHMRGQVAVTDYIRHLPTGDIKSLGFLMPCHSTPWQSHMHRMELETPHTASGYGGRIWAFTCEPPLSATMSYIDEDATFYADPCKFITASFPHQIDTRFPPSKGVMPTTGTSSYQWPSHLAVFDVLLFERCESNNYTILSMLDDIGYSQKKRFWNTLWHEDRRRSGDVVLFEHKQS